MVLNNGAISRSWGGSTVISSYGWRRAHADKIACRRVDLRNDSGCTTSDTAARTYASLLMWQRMRRCLLHFQERSCGEPGPPRCDPDSSREGGQLQLGKEPKILELFTNLERFHQLGFQQHPPRRQTRSGIDVFAVVVYRARRGRRKHYKIPLFYADI